MPTSIPSRIHTGNRQLDIQLEKLRRATQTSSHAGSSSSLINRAPGGTTHKAISSNRRSAIRANYTTLPNFLVYDASDSDGPKVGITGGDLNFYAPGFVAQVPKFDPDAVSDGDKAWVQYDGDMDWSLQTGADYPTDLIYISLANNIPVTAGTGGAPDYVDFAADGSDFDWEGGDMTPESHYAVTVDGSGDDPPTYEDITTLTGIDLVANYGLTGAPTNYRDAELSYTAGTKGYAKLLDDGSFEFFVEDEYVNHQTICAAVVTAGPDSNGCYTIAPSQVSVNTLKSPVSCP